jgi:hypothetical protein
MFLPQGILPSLAEDSMLYDFHYIITAEDFPRRMACGNADATIPYRIFLCYKAVNIKIF